MDCIDVRLDFHMDVIFSCVLGSYLTEIFITMHSCQYNDDFVLHKLGFKTCVVAVWTQIFALRIFGNGQSISLI